jgi:hypothetical protein
VEKERTKTRRSKIAQKEKDFGWLFIEKILFLHRNIKPVIHTERIIKEDLKGVISEKSLREDIFIGEYKRVKEILETKKSRGGIENHSFFRLEKRRKEEQAMIKHSFNI